MSVKKLKEAVAAGWLQADGVEHPIEPPPSFWHQGLEAGAQSELDALFALAGTGGFPKLMDFVPTLGVDLSWCDNLDHNVYAIGNDRSGNLFVLYQDGSVDLWCHEEGGYMQGWEFTSIADALQCLRLATLARRQAIRWDDVAAFFIEGAARSEGWAFFREEVEQHLQR